MPSIKVRIGEPIDKALRLLKKKLDKEGIMKSAKAHRFYDKLVKPYRVFGCMPECHRCDYLRRGQCRGGCLAHAMNSLDKLPPKRLKGL